MNHSQRTYEANKRAERAVRVGCIYKMMDGREAILYDYTEQWI